MTTSIIITICCLLLVAYLFDLSSPHTKIPSVILLLLLGFVVRQVSDFMVLPIPDLTVLLPIFGTVGLILIVLEGSLELELDKSKIPVILKSALVAFLPMLILSFSLAYALQYYSGSSFKISLTNAIPFCVISSAIAIPSARHLRNDHKEFIIFESSLSDILGVLFFNFVALNDNYNGTTIAHFIFELAVILLISAVATIGLSFLLSRIQHHIKFGPIIVLVILIYALSKLYHLPGLLFILLFGLFIGNLDLLKGFGWVQKLKPEVLDVEVQKFKELTIEATFLVRVLFFLLFGYLIQANEVLNINTLGWAGGIVAGIIIIRTIQLKIAGLPILPLLFIAPRGLITILLFLSIAPAQNIPLVNKSLLLQVIILTALLMMAGIITAKKSQMPDSSTI